MDFRVAGLGHVQDRSDSSYGCGNKHWGSIKYGEFLEKLRAC
jgi:hypothetical protein